MIYGLCTHAIPDHDDITNKITVHYRVTKIILCVYNYEETLG